MKVILSLLLVAMPLCVMAGDVVTFNGNIEPEWKDFAPSNYADVSEPKGLGKLNETASYWYKRRVDFETSMEECRLIDDVGAKAACFQEVKVKQFQQNSDYNARIEAMEKARMCPQEMYDKTNNMLPIGGYLDNFSRFQPNELR